MDHFNTHTLDQEAEIFLEKFNQTKEKAGQMSLPEARKASFDFFKKESKEELLPNVRIIDEKIPVQGGSIPVRVFIPEGKGPFPGLMFFHAGGWVFGSIEEEEPFCRKLASYGKCAIASVGYRLAPEHKFPIPLDDCFKATQFIFDNASKFSIDPQRFGVSGCSAGGNLAAAVALMARKKKELNISFQALFYPVLDSYLEKEVYKKCPGSKFLSYEAMQMFWGAYMRNDDDKKDPFASPLKAEDVSHLPKTLIVTADLDPLKKEGMAYAEKLKKAKNEVVSLHYDAFLHGFLSLPIHRKRADFAIQEIANHLKKITQ